MTAPLTAAPYQIEALGDQALVIVCGDRVDPDVNDRVCAVARRIQADRIRGVIDVVPSFMTVTVHFRLDELRQSGKASPLMRLRQRIEALIEEPAGGEGNVDTGVIEIPVCYGGEYGPDLSDAAAQCGLLPDELVLLHQAEVRVYMLGFAPGAPYIGIFDERMSVPRRRTPRLDVPAGSIGIANRQCVVYPVAAPGGWSLIGRTPLTFFDAVAQPPTLLAPGQRVRFKSIDESALLAWKSS